MSDQGKRLTWRGAIDILAWISFALPFFCLAALFIGPAEPGRPLSQQPLLIILLVDAIPWLAGLFWLLSRHASHLNRFYERHPFFASPAFRWMIIIASPLVVALLHVLWRLTHVNNI